MRTGDPADELFEGGGAEVNDIVARYIPQARRIANKIGLRTDFPYLDEGVVDIARTLRRSDNLKTVQGSVPSDLFEYYERKRFGLRTDSIEWGKISLRRAMYGVLPDDVVYRMKAPLQYGAWTYRLTETLGRDITEAEIIEFERQGKRFWTKDRAAHAELYKIYVRAGLHPPEVTRPGEEYECTWCSGAVEMGRKSCDTCGGWPANSKAGDS